MFKARELQSWWGIRWGYNKKPRIITKNTCHSLST